MWLLDFCDLLDNSIYTWGDQFLNRRWGDEDSSSMTEVHSNHLQRLNSGLPEGWEARLAAEQGRIYYLKWVLHNIHACTLLYKETKAISQIIKMFFITFMIDSWKKSSKSSIFNELWENSLQLRQWIIRCSMQQTEINSLHSSIAPNSLVVFVDEIKSKH